MASKQGGFAPPDIELLPSEEVDPTLPNYPTNMRKRYLESMMELERKEVEKESDAYDEIEYIKDHTDPSNQQDAK